MSKKRSPQEKASIVTEFFTTMSAAELCRKHNVSSATFQDWKEKFLQGRDPPDGSTGIQRAGVPTNRKNVQRISRKIGWFESQKSKKKIIRASRRRWFKPSGPNQLWETDITYIHCGIDGRCYCFNVLDVYTRRWVAYVFDTTAMAGSAVQSTPEQNGHVESFHGTFKREYVWPHEFARF